jgi:DNA-binding NtrC family response regulator
MLSYDWPGNIRELENVIERGVILAAENTVIDAPQLFTSGEQFTGKQFSISRDGALIDTDQTLLIEAQPSDPEVDRVSKHVNNFLNGVADDSTVSLDDIETLMLKQAVTRANGNVAAAARLLGITRPQMVYRLKSRGILAHGE